MLSLSPEDRFQLSEPAPLDAATLCATCGDVCPRPAADEDVAFCDECREASVVGSYPDGWVMLGGWD